MRTTAEIQRDIDDYIAKHPLPTNGTTTTHQELLASMETYEIALDAYCDKHPRYCELCVEKGEAELQESDDD